MKKSERDILISAIKKNFIDVSMFEVELKFGERSRRYKFRKNKDGSWEGSWADPFRVLNTLEKIFKKLNGHRKIEKRMGWK